MKFKKVIIELRKQKRISEEFYTNEWVMSAHLGVYFFYIIVYIPYSLCLSLYITALAKDDVDGRHNPVECKALLGLIIFFVMMYIANMISTILIIFMSVKFSKPLSNYRDQFVIIFQGDGLDEVVQAS